MASQRPARVQPSGVPHRSPFTPEGYAALIHAICHIEFNAIGLALDAIWRFEGMPRTYYLDWLRVAREEAFHFSLLREHLRTLGAQLEIEQAAQMTQTAAGGHQ